MSHFFAESDVAAKLTMERTVVAVRESFVRLARGEIRQEPRTVLLHPAGYFAAVCAIDDGLRLASVKSYTRVDADLRGFMITLTSTRDGAVQAVLEADRLTAMRTGAASGVAAAALARRGATSVGIIGCGRQAPFQVEAIRCAVPTVDSVCAWSRRPQALGEFCNATGARPAASAEEAAGCDIVVAATTSSTPVIDGELIRPGALVIAIGGDRRGARELDDAVIRRAALITCDSTATSRRQAADLWQPVDAGLITWDEVVPLHEVVTGAHPGRTDDDHIIVFKSNGLGAWDVAAAAALVAGSVQLP